MSFTYCFSASAAGNRHVLSGLPCEDRSGAALHPVPVIAVADGHSAEECSRAEQGAAFAIDAALHELSGFAAQLEKLQELEDAARREPIVRRLIGDLMLNWDRQINEHLLALPLTEEEQKYQPCLKNRYYGTTLLAAVQLGRFLLLLQQGDGCFVLLRADGSFERPMPDAAIDDGSEATYSLCDPDVCKAMHYQLIDLDRDPVIACCAMTDGVFKRTPWMQPPESLFVLTAAFLATCKELGEDRFQDWLSDQLPEYCKDNYQDDRSLAGLIDTAALNAFYPYLASYDLPSLRRELEECKRKRSAILRNLDVAESNCALARQKLSRLEDEVRRAEKALHDMEECRDRRDREEQALSERLAKAEAESEALRQQAIAAYQLGLAASNDAAEAPEEQETRNPGESRDLEPAPSETPSAGETVEATEADEDAPSLPPKTQEDDANEQPEALQDQADI